MVQASSKNNFHDDLKNLISAIFKTLCHLITKHSRRSYLLFDNFTVTGSAEK